MKPRERVPLLDRRGPLWRERSQFFWLALIVLLGFVLRIIHLGTHSFWHDEVHNLIKTEHLYEVLRHGEFVSNHPPLFTVLATVWRSIGPGPCEWWMRLLPLTLGLCGIVALYFVGKLLFGTRAGLLAAFLLAISPFHIMHSQDLKVYILLPFTGIVMVYCLYLATERNRPSLWALYGLMVAVVCYSDFFAMPLLVGVNLWFLSQLRGRLDRLRGWILSNMAGGLLFLPQLNIALQKTDNIMLSTQKWWVPRPTPWSAVFYVKTIAFGYSNLEPHFKIALFIFCAFALAGIVLSWKQNWRSALLLIFWFAVPTTLVFLVSQFTQSIFLIRAMLPYAIPLYIWVGLAMSKAEPRGLRRALPLLFACIAAFPLAQKYRGEYSVREFPHRPGTHAPMQYREAARVILSNLEEGDAVLHAGTWSWLPFYWYGFREVPECTHRAVAADKGFIKYFRDANPPITDRKEFDGVYPVYIQEVVEGTSRFWYVFSQWEREYLKYNAVPVWRWLDVHYPEIDHMDFGAFEVFLYAKEQNGQPVRAMARDEDDGASAEMTYAGGFDGTYVKHKADLGLVPSPPAMRRGNLTLRFDEERAAETASFTQGSTSRIVSFAVENRVDREVECQVELVVTDYLINVASLFESRPESDVWAVSTLANPAAPPPDYDVPTAVAHARHPESAALHGAIKMAPGTYETSAYLFHHPPYSGNGLADIHIEVGGQTLSGNLAQISTPPEDWRWWITMPATIRPDETTVPVSVTVGARRDDGASGTSLAYLGFRKMRDTPRQSTTEDIFLPTWPGEIILPPLSTTRWSAEIDAEAKRVDVWVYERAPDGRAYRIFQILRD